MSTLKEKAKTAYDIGKECACPTPESSSCVGCTFDCETKEKKLYVPLEDALALEAKLAKLSQIINHPPHLFGIGDEADIEKWKNQMKEALEK